MSDEPGGFELFDEEGFVLLKYTPGREPAQSVVRCAICDGWIPNDAAAWLPVKDSENRTLGRVYFHAEEGIF